MQNYFQLFALTPEFDIDAQQLEASYQAQIAQYHPDKFASEDEKSQLQAVQNTSLINSAFDTLKDPLNRATYLLELNNIQAFDEKDTKMDVDFLMAQIELRESLEAIQADADELALDDFIENIGAKIKDNIAQISTLFASGEMLRIKNLVRELKFYTQLNTQAQALMDEFL